MVAGGEVLKVKVPTKVRVGDVVNSRAEGRRKLTEDDVVLLRNGNLPKEIVYIGRGSNRWGLPRSKWANPFRMTSRATRDGVIADFERYLDESGLTKDLEEL